MVENLLRGRLGEGDARSEGEKKAGEEEEEGRDGAARVEADLLELVSSRASRDGGASSSDVVVVVEGCGDGRAEEAKPLFLLLKLQSKLRR